jgi:hypothetical protein
MEIYHVSPYQVLLLDGDVDARDVKRQRERLETEGQIEPIEVIQVPVDVLADPAPLTYTLAPYGWVYASAQVAAARELGWPTILITC